MYDRRMKLHFVPYACLVFWFCCSLFQSKILFRFFLKFPEEIFTMHRFKYGTLDFIRICPSGALTYGTSALKVARNWDVKTFYLFPPEFCLGFEHLFFVPLFWSYTLGSEIFLYQTIHRWFFFDLHFVFADQMNKLFLF